MTIQSKRYGGARRDRTDDLLNANQALSQLSYGPEIYTAWSLDGAKDRIVRLFRRAGGSGRI